MRVQISLLICMSRIETLTSKISFKNPNNNAPAAAFDLYLRQIIDILLLFLEAKNMYNRKPNQGIMSWISCAIIVPTFFFPKFYLFLSLFLSNKEDASPFA